VGLVQVVHRQLEWAQGRPCRYRGRATSGPARQRQAGQPRPQLHEETGAWKSPVNQNRPHSIVHTLGVFGNGSILSPGEFSRNGTFGGGLHAPSIPSPVAGCATPGDRSPRRATGGRWPRSRWRPGSPTRHTCPGIFSESSGRRPVIGGSKTRRGERKGVPALFKTDLKLSRFCSRRMANAQSRLMLS